MPNLLGLSPNRSPACPKCGEETAKLVMEPSNNPEHFSTDLPRQKAWAYQCDCGMWFLVSVRIDVEPQPN
jgi:hypothetical protein